MPISQLTRPTLTTHAPAADTAAVVELSAPSGGSVHKIVQIDWSYSEDPAAGSVTIAFGSSTYVVAVTNGGPGQLHFPYGVGNGPTEAVTITLAAGGGTAVGKLNVLSF